VAWGPGKPNRHPRGRRRAARGPTRRDLSRLDEPRTDVWTTTPQATVTLPPAASILSLAEVENAEAVTWTATEISP
jgi:hypothetical protein